MYMRLPFQKGGLAVQQGGAGTTPVSHSLVAVAQVSWRSSVASACRGRGHAAVLQGNTLWLCWTYSIWLMCCCTYSRVWAPQPKIQLVQCCLGLWCAHTCASALPVQ